jgi:hypothetical protein
VGAEEVFKTVARTTRGLYLPLSEAPLLIPLITGVAEVELGPARGRRSGAGAVRDGRAAGSGDPGAADDL